MKRRPPRKESSDRTPAAVRLANDVIVTLRERMNLGASAQPFVEEDSGQLSVYNGTFWEVITEHTAKSIIYDSIDDKSRSTDRQRSDALRELRTICHRQHHKWGRVPDYEVPVLNGVVDVRTMRLRPHVAEDYLQAIIPVAYERNSPHPALDAYMASCFGDAEDQRPAALRAFAGYIVLPHARFKKAAVLYGPGDTGKSVFVELMRALVGPDGSCTLSVEDMDDPTRRHVLVGKMLNTLTELPADAAIRDGGFKTLVSTEEPILINPKYGHAFQYVSQAKHLIATNSLPRVTDRTDATLNRLYVIPFDRVIPEDERIRDLQARFRLELPGVLEWALQGAAELMRTGAFPPVDIARRRLDDLREEANPVAAYVRQVMVEEGAAVTPVNEITKSFNAWQGGGRKLELRQVCRGLRAAFGEDCLRRAWNDSLKAQAQSLVGWRLPTARELELAEGRQDWTVKGGPS